MKYGKMITGLILLALLVSCMGVLNAIDPKDNVTVTMDGVSFDAPRTSNNTTDFTKTPTGGITWAYEDYEHNLSVYVSDEMPEGYSTKEEYDSITGISQMTSVGGRWVVVCADDFDVKDLVWDSLRAA